ncbi:MAG: hypothetical protein IME99_04320 [Proteobacteria bacterium]|nr:hypothetical protein [Pseudomonadota bacterium]
MAAKSSGYLRCPMCDAEVPLEGDEKQGSEIFCPFCQTPLSFKVGRDEEAFFEEDF